jgi:hypothetical protein
VLASVALLGAGLVPTAHAATASRTPSPSPPAIWKYRDDGVDLGNAKPWVAPGYDDSTWLSGPPILGFGFPGNITTTLSNVAKSLTYYFRRNLTGTVNSVSSARVWTMNLICDDAAVVYVNGKELTRYNLPNGTITHKTVASTAVASVTQAMTPVTLCECGRGGEGERG